MTMVPPTSAPDIKPGSWLTELSRIKPAKWQWNRSIRAAICVGLPLSIGLSTGAMALGVWGAIASLMVINTETNGSYHSRFKAIAISASLGSLGCLAGYIGPLPWGWVVLSMAVLAFLTGTISSYGAPFSAGMLQFLVIASVAIGRPQIAPFWEPMLYCIGGTLFYLSILGVEALLLRAQPRRQMICALVNALAQLATRRAEALEQGSTAIQPLSDAATGQEQMQPESSTTAQALEQGSTATEQTEAARRAVTTHQANLYADILGRHARKAGRTSENDSIWALLQSSDDAFAAILSTDSPARLRKAAENLAAIATAIGNGKKKLLPQATLDANASPEPLERSIRAMALAKQWSHSPFNPILPSGGGGQKNTSSHTSRLQLLGDRLLPGKETFRSALALALCVALSYAAHWFDHDARWYWVPLTVAIIMKPDFGSIFARSLLRTVGTLVGALLGSVILFLVPKGLILVLIMAILASLMPWVVQRSYALFAVVLTPLVLILIDLTIPGDINVNYAVQRFVGTAIGAGIVLVFGYFFWPRTHAKEIAGAFKRATGAIADYLLAANGHFAAAMAAPAMPISKRRRIAYARLTDLRTRLQKTMSEPPPAGIEATAWLPIVASAERICDSITAYSVRTQVEGAATPPPEILQLAQMIRSAPESLPAGSPPKPDIFTECAHLPSPERELIGSVADELRFITRSTMSTDATLPQLITQTAQPSS